MSKYRKTLFASSLILLLQLLLPQSHAFDQKVTNEIDITSSLKLPTSKMQRGETFFELTMSDLHFERSRGSCPGVRSTGMTAFKILGTSEEWEKSLGGYNYPNGSILKPYSDGINSLQYVDPFGSPVSIGGISTWVYTNSYSKKMIFQFKTTGWKGGEYEVIGFTNDGCRDFTMVTKKFLLPEIPKAQLNCTSPISTFQSESFEIKCDSNLELSVNGVVVEFNEKDGWTKLASNVASGRTFTFSNIKTELLGVIELRVRLIGIIDQIQDSTSNTFYIQSNAPKLNLQPKLEISKLSKDQPAKIKMISGNNPIDANLQGSKSPNGPWIELGRISSNSIVSKDVQFGTWVRITYDGNAAVNSGVSVPYQVLITPTTKCTFPSSVISGQSFKVVCTSNQSLQPTPVRLQYLDSSNKWISIDNGTLSGSKSTFLFKLEGQGNQKLRIQSDGLKDSYSGFASNVASLKFSAKNASSGNSGSPEISFKPKGKVDKTSNSYKLMVNFGRNLASNSLASDTAQSQCLSARNSGLVKVRGIPQYLGQQANQIQSYLATASGFQGCLDGFGKQ